MLFAGSHSALCIFRVSEPSWSKKSINQLDLSLKRTWRIPQSHRSHSWTTPERGIAGFHLRSVPCWDTELPFRCVVNLPEAILKSCIVIGISWEQLVRISKCEAVLSSRDWRWTHSYFSWPFSLLRGVTIFNVWTHRSYFHKQNMETYDSKCLIYLLFQRSLKNIKCGLVERTNA